MTKLIALQTLALVVFSLPALSIAGSSANTLLLNNDHVEVVRLSYPPGTESGMHSHQHPHRVVYVEQGGILELVPADQTKESKTITLPTGAALFLPGTTHNVKNIGDTNVILVETEIKGQN